MRLNHIHVYYLLVCCQNALNRDALGSCNLAFRMNRSAQHELEKDQRDKEGALQLDTTCYSLRNNSRGIAYHDGAERMDNT